MNPETRKQCERLIGIRLPRCRLLLSAGSLALVCGASAVLGQPFAYVVNYFCGTIQTPQCTVSVIDTATDTVLATIPVGLGARDIAIAPDGTRAYVTNQFDGTISVIDTATNTVVGTIDAHAFGPLGNPGCIVITPDGRYAYIQNYAVGDCGYGSVSILDTTAGTVQADAIHVGACPQCIAIDQQGSRIYVTNSDDTISVIDPATNTVAATITLPPHVGDVAFTPDGKRAYAGIAVGMAGTISIIDTATNSVVGAPIQLGGKAWEASPLPPTACGPMWQPATPLR